MSKRRQALRALVSERLTAAAEEIFALVERTIAEYEEELCRSKEENQRRQQLLDQVLKPKVVLRRTETFPVLKQEKGVGPQIHEAPSIEVKEEHPEELPVTMETTHQEDTGITMRADLQDTGSTMGADLQDSGSTMGADLQDPGSTMGADLQDSGSTMGADQEDAGSTMRADLQDSGSTMGADLQEDAGSTMGADLQEDAGSTMGTSWEDRAIIMGIPWKDMGVTMETAWEDTGASTETCWEDIIVAAQTSSDIDDYMQRNMSSYEYFPETYDDVDYEFQDWTVPLFEDSGDDGANPETRDGNMEQSQSAESEFNNQREEAKTNYCSLCKRKFARLCQLKRHMDSHRMKSFTCLFCEKTFSDKKSLRVHVMLHTGEQSSRLKHDQYVEITDKNMEGNRSAETKRVKGQIKRCKLCPATFDRNADYEKHRFYHRAKYLTCSHCQKIFTTPKKLSNHVRVHMEDRPYQCILCHKRYKTKGILSSHLKTTHSKVKSFSCTVCEAAFKSSGSLAKHMYQHTGKRPFACSFCEESFKRKFQLKWHMSKHKDTDKIKKPTKTQPELRRSVH